MRKFFVTASVSMLLLACGGEGLEVDSETVDPNEVNNIDQSIIDGDFTYTTAIGGKMFSIPSPVQMSLLLKDEVGAFNEEMISNPDNVSNFTTTYKKAVNMGVYGADLSYATIFENNTKAVSYLASVEKLADELGIAGAFDEELIERFIDNGHNQDSMLVIMSDGYREGDKFLKDNEQHDVATLILTGGWLESLYFATMSYEKDSNQEIANRIGEQKTSLFTIIDLLEGYNKDEFYSELISDLESLKDDFNKIEFNYQFIKPQTNEKAGITVIKSKTSVSIDDKTMSNIVGKVKEIREKLIG
jgi:hypothetical protein